MKTYDLQNMIKGWFVGDFDPVVLRSSDFEVAVKYYKAGDVESLHVHKIAKEITVVVEGTVIMNGKTFKKGEIILLEPGEPTDFKVVDDAITVVVKTPSAKADKYLL